MQPDPYMSLFTVISFTMLGFGSVILSVVSRMGTGSQLWSIIMGASTLAAGTYIWMAIDQLGVFPALLGFVALMIAVTQPRRRSGE